jgi:hypothetical protein
LLQACYIWIVGSITRGFPEEERVATPSTPSLKVPL